MSRVPAPAGVDVAGGSPWPEPPFWLSRIAAAMAAAKPSPMSAERETPLGCGTSRSTRSTQSRVRARSLTLAGTGCGGRGCAKVIVPAPERNRRPCARRRTDVDDALDDDHRGRSSGIGADEVGSAAGAGLHEGRVHREDPLDLDERLADEVGQRADPPAAVRPHHHLGAGGVAEHRVGARPGVDPVAGAARSFRCTPPRARRERRTTASPGSRSPARRVPSTTMPSRRASPAPEPDVDVVHATTVGDSIAATTVQAVTRRTASSSGMHSCRSSKCRPTAGRRRRARRHRRADGMGLQCTHAGVPHQLRFASQAPSASASDVVRYADELPLEAIPARSCRDRHSSGDRGRTATRSARGRSRSRWPQNAPSSARPVMSDPSGDPRAIGRIATSRAIASIWAANSSTPQRSSAGQGSGIRSCPGSSRSDRRRCGLSAAPAPPDRRRRPARRRCVAAACAERRQGVGIDQLADDAIALAR